MINSFFVILPNIHDKISGFAKSHSSKIKVFPFLYADNKIPGINFIELSSFITSLPNKSSVVVCSERAVDKQSFLLIFEATEAKKLFPAEVNP